MFAMNELTVAAEAAYRREQLLAALPVRRARKARAARVTRRIIGRRATAPARPQATVSGAASAAPAGAVKTTPVACAA